MALIPNSVFVTGVMAPSDSADTYAVTDTIYGLDGLRNVSNIADRNAIPNDRRRQGMIVGVLSGSSTQYYTLLNSTWTGTNSDWAPFSFISGMTFNPANYDLTLNTIDGNDFTQSLSILATDVTITGGTYSASTGVVTFVNSSGGTFQVSGFTSGFTDTNIYNTDGALSNNRVVNLSTNTLSFSSSTYTNNLVLSGGNVGIGTATPTSGLHLKDKIFNIDGVSPTSGIKFTYTNGTNHFITVSGSDLTFQTTSQSTGDLRRTIQINNGFSTVNTVPFLQLKENESQVPIWVINPSTATTSNYSGVLNIRLNNPGGYLQTYNLAAYNAADTLVSYIKPNGDGYYLGNVGIGTTAITNTLTVSAATDPVKFIGLSSTGTTDFGLVTTSSSGVLHVLTGGTNRVVFFDSTGKIASSSGFTYATTLNSPNESTGNLSLPATSSYITFGGGRVVISSVGIPNGLNLELAASQGSLGNPTQYPDISKTFTFKNKPWNTHLTMGHYDAPNVKFKSGAYVLTSAPYGLFGGQVVINYPSAIGAPNPIRGFWGTQGSGFNVLGVTYTEANATSTPATRTDIVANSFQIPTFSANTTVITTSQNYLTASSPLTVYSADTAGVIQSITINDGLASAFYTAGIYTLPSLGTSYTAATFTAGEMLSANTTGYIGVSFTQKIAQTGATGPGFFTGFTTGTTTYYTGVTTAVTYSSLTNVYIAGAPTKGNNIFGDTYALKINSGEAYFGGGLKMKSDTNLTILSGSNSAVGTVTLIAGSKIVTNALAKTSSTIMLTRQSSTSAPAANIYISNKTNGSFTISSSSLLDDGDVAYMIINTV